MAKSNIRSIRLSDEILEVIEAQAGENFTAKYEALITRCMFELPAAEKKLEQINQQIYEKRQQLGRLSQKADAFAAALRNMERDLQSLGRTIAKAQEHEPPTFTL